LKAPQKLAPKLETTVFLTARIVPLPCHAGRKFRHFIDLYPFPAWGDPPRAGYPAPPRSSDNDLLPIRSRKPFTNWAMPNHTRPGQVIERGHVRR